jgi:hypothetical protein
MKRKTRSYTMKNKSLALLGILLLAAGSLGAAQVATEKAEMFSPLLEGQVFNAVLSTPRYGVYDAISFNLEGNHVILSGYVVMPVTGIDAAKRVAKIDGIEKVTNQIERLPLSGMDSAIRRQVYRQVFNTANLYRYALGANPSTLYSHHCKKRSCDAGRLGLKPGRRQTGRFGLKTLF